MPGFKTILTIHQVSSVPEEMSNIAANGSATRYASSKACFLSLMNYTYSLEESEMVPDSPPPPSKDFRDEKIEAYLQQSEPYDKTFIGEGTNSLEKAIETHTKKVEKEINEAGKHL